MSRFATFLVITMLCGIAAAQKPIVQLPKTYINTTYAQPSGTTWLVHSSPQLNSAINASVPGDMIVLDAGVTYSGNFHIPSKSNPNNKWIYVVSSALNKLPVAHRVSPSDAANMPRIVTPNVTAAIIFDGGANHWRFAGIEVTSTSTYVPSPTVSPNGYTYFLVGSQSFPTPLPDSITFDRCYIHGSPTQDVAQGIIGSGSNYAVVDSYISGIHASGQDTQAFLAFDTPGPIKLFDNYLEAAGENVMFGGSGKNNNRGVPSDIEARNNYLYKPLSWAKSGLGGTLAPNNQWVAKNAFELKSAQRVLIDGNVIENVWAAGQSGFAILLTVRTSQSGDFAVVNDVTITNNVLKNVVSGFNTSAKDDECGPGGGYPDCKNAGSQDRWNIADNLILFYDPTRPGGARNIGLQVGGGMDRINNTPGTLRDVVFQHNTMVSAASTPCAYSVFFSANGQAPPFPVPLTSNLWVVDNAFCRQPTGDWGLRGTSGLTQYMGAPASLDSRYAGNVMYFPTGDKIQVFPVHNYASTVPFIYVNPIGGNYQLASPYWTDTTDGALAGVSASKLSPPSLTASAALSIMRR
ncbi:MAG TPA: hypothetical protein VMT56_01030 [Candidatus Bathyarchaeia archaeon]|nr:hypothetical protein [Candidatus Bathyarchaeia archaeon]